MFPEKILFLLPLLLSNGRGGPILEDFRGEGVVGLEERRIMSNLIEEDGEILDEKVETKRNEMDEDARKRRKSHKKLPAYLIFLEEEEAKDAGAREMDFGGIGEPNHPLARVWLPFEINEEGRDPGSGAPIKENTTKVYFQHTQSLLSLGDFTAAEIVVTMRNDVGVGGGGPLTLRVLGNHQNTSSADEVRVIRSKSQYIPLDITPLILSQLEAFQETNESKVLEVGLQLQDNLLPLPLDVNKTSERRSRGKRSVQTTPTPTNHTTNGNRTGSVPNGLCQKQSWSVDLYDDLNWYEIISPRRLELGFCAGKCPFPLQNDHFNYTLHAFFVDRHIMKKVFDVPRNFPKQSCCVPISYKKIRPWIEEEENSFVQREITDVVVDSCGCR